MQTEAQKLRWEELEQRRASSSERAEGHLRKKTATTSASARKMPKLADCYRCQADTGRHGERSSRCLYCTDKRIEREKRERECR